MYKWFVNTARTEARYAWESSKECLVVAAKQAGDAWVDDQATRAKAWFARTLQGWFPA